MLRNHRANRALSHAHHQWNGFAFSKPATTHSHSVRCRLKSTQIVIDDSDILVTECGFVTMAIHIDRATEHGDALVVPGVDSNGTRGFLVLRDNAVPYHSLSLCSAEACDESVRSHRKAQALLAAYGDKNNLRAAVRKAPWYKLVTEQDLISSGLCSWGSESFLRRFGLLPVARRFGLPRLMLRLAGPYGDRVTAASLLRSPIE